MTILVYRLQVESFSTPGQWSTISSTITDTTYTQGNIVDNLLYKFRVFSVNSLGLSDASNVAAIWTLPTAPTGVTATAISGTEIDVAWNTSTGITYELEHSTDNVTFTPEADPATTPYSDTGLTIDTTHYYKVYAVNPSGTSPASTVASATTFDIPTQPLNLILTPTAGPPINLLEVTLTWALPADNGGTAITEYYVERSTDNNTWGAAPSGTITPPTRSYTDSSLVTETTYYYRVLAENSVGVGDWSATVEYESPTLPGAASSLTAEPYGTQNNKIRVNWDEPANSGSHPVIGYKIERNDGGAGWSVWTEDTASASEYITDDVSISAGVEYAYRVYPKTAAGTATQASNVDQVTLVDADVSISVSIIGGNTIEIIPTVDISAASPGAELKLLNLYMDNSFVTSVSGGQNLPIGVTNFSAMYAYPTEEAQFHVIMVITQHDGNNHQLTLTSSAVSATPSDPFTGDLDWDEFRIIPGSQIPSEQDFTQSNLELDIQPVGSNIIVKYTPSDPSEDPVILGFDTVSQNLAAVVNTNANTDYYVGVYIDPEFYNLTGVSHDGSLLGGTAGVLEIDCSVVDLQPFGLVCQEDDVPLGYKSNIAFRSLKDPTSPTQLGIEGMGDLFGMPMVMLFVIGIAAVFTGRSAQMGGIIIVALVSIMIYLGYLPLMWENPTWAILLIICGIGIFIGKRWS